MRIYHPVVRFVLNFNWLVIFAALAIVAFTVPVYMKLGSEFMPPLNEGTILYMPTLYADHSSGDLRHRSW